MVVNAAARAISCRSRFSHITDFIRHDLHWLPIKQRIQVKASMLVYKSLQDCCPAYIKNLICHSTLATRRPGLRSSLRQNLIVLRYRNKFAERVFAVGIHLKWNNLPDHIHFVSSLTTLRKLLMVHLFSVASSNRMVSEIHLCEVFISALSK